MRSKNTRGQGLLETIVAIGVITTGLISVITLVISNLTAQREAALRYRALNFAREGLETVRNARDSNWLLLGRGSPWEGLRGEGEAILAFEDSFNETNFTPAIVSGRTDATVICQSADGLFVQRPLGCAANDEPTPFQRVISLEILSCGEVFSGDAALCENLEEADVNIDEAALRAVVRVSWSDAGRERQVELIEVLYDWR